MKRKGQIIQRICKLEKILQDDIRDHYFYLLWQVAPNSKEYRVEETFKCKTKKYIIDDIKKFYEENDRADTHIIKIDVCENRTEEQVLKYKEQNE